MSETKAVGTCFQILQTAELECKLQNPFLLKAHGQDNGTKALVLPSELWTFNIKGF